MQYRYRVPSALTSDNLATATPVFKKFGARVVVRGVHYLAMEGHVRNRNVVGEFKDYDTAIACYQSPEYQVAKNNSRCERQCQSSIVESAPN